ncbi:MAG: hypothetical protein ACI4XQ_04995 [Eubacteriales bacterium]
MALTDHKVDPLSDYAGRDISGLPDVPAISSEQLKARFDSLVKDVVVPKYNALIDELGEPAHRVISAPEGNLAMFGENGEIADSDVAASEVEKARRSCVISGTGGSVWYRVAHIALPSIVNDARTVKFEGFSGMPASKGRGHWTLIVSLTNAGNNYRKRSLLAFADNGITPDNFDLRELAPGEYALWFKPAANTSYSIFATVEGDIKTPWLELYGDDTTETSGTAIDTVYPGFQGFSFGVFTAEAVSGTAWSDIAAEGITAGSAAVAMSNTENVGIREVLCQSDGTARIYWADTPQSDCSVVLSLLYTV